jgi:hypothetical protein
VGPETPTSLRKARFVLQPCQLFAGHFISSREEEPLTLDWASLCSMLAPSQERQALVNLRMLQTNAFVGLTKNPLDGSLKNFIFLNQDRSNKAEWFLKRDPSFEQRLHRVYRVDEAQWESVVTEVSSD